MLRLLPGAEPPAEEIRSSAPLSFLMMKHEELGVLVDPNARLTIFGNVLDAFVEFFREERNNKLLSYFVPKLTKDILSVASEFFGDRNVVDKLFTILEMINTRDLLLLLKPEIVQAFYSVIESMHKNPHLKECSRNLFLGLFAEELFCVDVFGELNKIVDNVYATKEAADYFSEMILTSSRTEVFKNINLVDIVPYVSQNREKIECKVELAKFLSLAASKSKLGLIEQETFEVILSLLDKTEADDLHSCLSLLLIRKGELNLTVIKHVYGYFCQHSDLQQVIFDWLCEIVRMYPSAVLAIHKSVSWEKWFTDEIATESLIKLDIFADEIRSGQIVPLIIELILNRLGKEERGAEFYSQFMHIVEIELRHHTISLDFLQSADFLGVFVLKPKQETVIDLFKKSEIFSQLAYETYVLDKDKRERVFVLLVDMFAKCQDISRYLSAFMLVSPSESNVRMVMNAVTKYRNPEAFRSLKRAISKDIVIGDIFVNKVDGILWMESIFQDSIITTELYLSCVKAITSHTYWAKMDDYLYQLDKNHPIMHAGKDKIREIVYGKESGIDSPMRVRSMIKAMGYPETVNVYNAYVIGKYGMMRSPEDILTMPCRKEVAARYLSDESFKHLMERGTDLSQYCDPMMDHFPIFYIYRTAEMMMSFPFTCLSFWFRLETPLSDLWKEPIFHADNLYLSIQKGNELYATYNGISYGAKIDPNGWNFILIKVYTQRASHTVKAEVNGCVAVFRCPKEKREFSSFAWSSHSSSIVLSPAIRISRKNRCEKPEDIFFRGASYLGYSEEGWEDLIITPFGYHTPQFNVFGIPYRGFPFHFTMRANSELLYERIEKSDTPQNFQENMKLAFSVFRIVHRYLPDFYTKILSVFGKVPQFITKQCFIDLMEVVRKKMTDNDIIKETLQHKDAWDNISNDILIFTLFQTFKTFDFVEDLKSLQKFLASRIPKNPTSSFIMTVFLVNMKILPICVKQMIRWMRIGEPALQKTIIICINKFMNQTKRIDEIKSIMPFATAKAIFLISRNDVQAQIFALMVAIELESPGYMVLSHDFTISFARSVVHEIAWNSATMVCSSDGKAIFKPRGALLLLSLVWSGICLSIHNAWENKEPNELMEEDLEKAMLMLRMNHQMLIQCPEFVETLNIIFPYIIGDRKGMIEDIKNAVVKESDGKLCEVERDCIDFMTYIERSSWLWYLLELEIAYGLPLSAMFTEHHAEQRDKKYQRFFEVYICIFLHKVLSHLKPSHSNVIYAIESHIAHGNTFESAIIFLNEFLMFCSVFEQTKGGIFAGYKDSIHHVIHDIIVSLPTSEMMLLFSVLHAYVPFLTKLVSEFSTCYLEIFADRANMADESFAVFFDRLGPAVDWPADSKELVESLLSHQYPDQTELKEYDLLCIVHGATSSKYRDILPRVEKNYEAMCEASTAGYNKLRAHLCRPSQTEEESCSSSDNSEFVAAIPRFIDNIPRLMVPVEDHDMPKLVFSGSCEENSKHVIVSRCDLSFKAILVVEIEQLVLTPIHYEPLFLSTLAQNHWRDVEILNNEAHIHIDYCDITHVFEISPRRSVVVSMKMAPFVVEYEGQNPLVSLESFVTQEKMKELITNSITLWQRHNISSTSLLLNLNAANNCFLCDPVNPPVLNDMSDESLRQFCKTNFNVDIGSRAHSHRATDIHTHQLCEEIVGTYSHKHFSLAGSLVLRNPVKLSDLICTTKRIFLIVEITKMKISIFNGGSSLYIFSDRATRYGYARYLDVSSSRQFFVVDFKNWCSSAYMIHTKNGIPCDFEELGTRHSTSQPRSVINGRDGICASVEKNDVSIWDIFTGKTIRTISHASVVLGADFDEHNGLLWTVTDSSLAVFTVNGEKLKEMTLSSAPSCIRTAPDCSRTAIVGFIDGGLKLFTVENGELLSKSVVNSGTKIAEIIVHPSSRLFATVDSNGKALLWTGKGVKMQIKQEFVEICAVCRTNEATSSCHSCGRWVCEECCANSFCNDCR